MKSTKKWTISGVNPDNMWTNRENQRNSPNTTIKYVNPKNASKKKNGNAKKILNVRQKKQCPRIPPSGKINEKGKDKEEAMRWGNLRVVRRKRNDTQLISPCKSNRFDGIKMIGLISYIRRGLIIWREDSNLLFRNYIFEHRPNHFLANFILFKKVFRGLGVIFVLFYFQWWKLLPTSADIFE